VFGQSWKYPVVEGGKRNGGECIAVEGISAKLEIKSNCKLGNSMTSQVPVRRGGLAKGASRVNQAAIRVLEVRVIEKVEEVTLDLE
jgi:hypothetical protein